MYTCSWRRLWYLKRISKSYEQMHKQLTLPIHYQFNVDFCFKLPGSTGSGEERGPVLKG